MHYPDILEKYPPVDWFEAVTENFLDTFGRPLHVLEQVRSRYPVGLHGVSLSIGSTDPLNREYVKKLKALAERIDPALITDHLCWTGVNGANIHDLLPLPFTEESVHHVASRVGEVQEFLGRRILLENVSAYVGYPHSTMSEWEFLTKVAIEADCGILLDVNNVYVNSRNFQFDPSIYLESLPTERVGQIHLAGHTDKGSYLFDTHDAHIIEEVWILYRQAIERFGAVSTLIEWDAKIPSFTELLGEADRAKKIQKDVYEKRELRRAVA
jgi:uncharacterized protein (UPF0276 family)